VSIPIGFLSPAVVSQVLADHPHDLDFPLSYMEEATQAVATLTSGQPFLVQQIGDMLVERYNLIVFTEEREHSGTFTVDDVRAVVDAPKFFTMAAAYFEGVWGQATGGRPGELELLKALAAGPDAAEPDSLRASACLDDPSFAVALSSLERHRIVERSNGSVRYSVPLMRRWVIETQLRSPGLKRKSKGTEP
jgi:hypothetical protein